MPTPKSSFFFKKEAYSNYVLHSVAPEILLSIPEFLSNRLQLSQHRERPRVDGYFYRLCLVVLGVDYSRRVVVLCQLTRALVGGRGDRLHIQNPFQEVCDNPRLVLLPRCLYLLNIPVGFLIGFVLGLFVAFRVLSGDPHVST